MLLNKILCKNYVKLGKNCASKTKKQTNKPKKTGYTKWFFISYIF